MRTRFHRALPAQGRKVSVWLEDERVEACEGESLLAVILSRRDSLPGSGPDGARTGFCLMGACQECWLQVEHAGPVRACTTKVSDGMRIGPHVADTGWEQDE